VVALWTKLFFELEVNIAAGDQTVTVREVPLGWSIGDEIVFPDTRQVSPVDLPGFYDYQGQYETAYITAINDRVITLESPLEYPHVGPSDADGSPTIGFDGAQVMPHVGNLTRNVTFRSENPDGVRGHTMSFADSVRDIRYAAFEELGRTTPGEIDNTTYDSEGKVTKIGTNQIARYADHLHRVRGPEAGIELEPGGPSYQWISVGNSVTGALKWGTTIHASNFGLLSQTVYYDTDGAAIATENGSEYENLIDGNFIVRVNGGGGTFTPIGVQNSRGGIDNGDLGDGIWLGGPLNTVSNNIVTNVARNAYVVYTENVPTVNRSTNRPVQVPLFPGANPHLPGTTREVNVQAEPFDDFFNNEAYGATTAAVWLWSVGDRTNFPDTPGRNTLTNTTVWHVSASGVYFYYANDHVIDGWLQRGDPDAIGRPIGDGGSKKKGAAITHGGSRAATSEVTRADIQGVEIGFYNRGRGIADSISIANSYFDNRTNILSEPWTQNPLDGVRDFVLRDIAFGNELNPGANRNVEMRFRAPKAAQKIASETTTVFDFGGNPGIDLDVYYESQAPDVLIDEDVPSPAAGLSNREGFDRFGVANGGRVAPTYEIDGDGGDAARLRALALGITGLVFEIGTSSTPQLFANTYMEFGVPTLYFTVLGNTTSVSEVVLTIDEQEFRFNDRSGRLVLDFLSSPVGKFEIEGQLKNNSQENLLDGVLQSSLSLPMRVNTAATPNSRPVIAPIDAISVTANQPIQFNLDWFDPDGDDVQLSVQDLPDGASFDSTTGEFTWTPKNSDVGLYLPEFLALDSRNGGSTTQARIQVAFDASESPLIGLWTFAGDEASDLSSYGNDGVVVGTTTNLAGGLRFDGLNDLVTIPKSNVLRPEEAISLEVTAAPDGGFGRRDLVRFNSGSWSAYALQVKDGGYGPKQGYYFTVTTENGRQTLFAPKLVWDGAWDNVTATFDGSVEDGRAEIYLNGILVASKTSLGSRLNYKPFSSQQVTIGGNSDSADSFVGAIARVSIQATAITPLPLVAIPATLEPSSDVSEIPLAVAIEVSIPEPLDVAISNQTVNHLTLTSPILKLEEPNQQAPLSEELDDLSENPMIRELLDEIIFDENYDLLS